EADAADGAGAADGSDVVGFVALPAESSHGAGSADPLPGGGSPHESFTIKGNADSMLYHPSDSPYFSRTIAEVWFDSEEAAERAGFTHWDRN
ncbi:MAG: 50S ribosomal protein L17, partial [Nocardioides sp.]